MLNPITKKMAATYITQLYANKANNIVPFSGLRTKNKPPFKTHISMPISISQKTNPLCIKDLNTDENVTIFVPDWFEGVRSQLSE